MEQCLGGSYIMLCKGVFYAALLFWNACIQNQYLITTQHQTAPSSCPDRQHSMKWMYWLMTTVGILFVIAAQFIFMYVQALRLPHRCLLSKNIPFVNSSQNSKENSSFQNANMCLMHVGHFFQVFNKCCFCSLYWVCVFKHISTVQLQQTKAGSAGFSHFYTERTHPHNGSHYSFRSQVNYFIFLWYRQGLKTKSKRLEISR